MNLSVQCGSLLPDATNVGWLELKGSDENHGNGKV